MGTQEKEMDLLKEDNDKLEEEVIKLNKTKEIFVKKYDSLLTDHGNANRKSVDDNLIMLEQLDKTKLDVQELKKENEAAQEERKQLLSELEEAKGEEDDMKALILSYNKQIGKLEASESKLKKEIESMHLDQLNMQFSGLKLNAAIQKQDAPKQDMESSAKPEFEIPVENKPKNKTEGVYSAVPFHKPNMYSMGQNFKHFLAPFKVFAAAAGIPDHKFIDVLLTYIDPVAQRRTSTLGLTDEDKAQPEKALAMITQVLTDTRDAATAKTRLLRSQQEPSQSIAAYASELLDLANEVYGSEAEKRVIKSEILLDVFIQGIRDTNLAIQVMQAGKMTFEETLSYAVQLEAIYANRCLQPDQ